MTVEEYAKKILSDNGCDEYSYGDEYSKYIMDDLKTGYPDGMEFPYIDVANAILAMSHPKPIVRKPYVVRWYTDSDSDEYGCDSLEEAMYDAEDMLVNWQVAEMSEWSEDGPTEEQEESWDYMIFNCGVSVWKYNPDTDEYEEEVWEPDDEFPRVAWEEWRYIDHTGLFN